MQLVALYALLGILVVGAVCCGPLHPLSAISCIGVWRRVQFLLQTPHATLWRERELIAAADNVLLLLQQPLPQQGQLALRGAWSACPCTLPVLMCTHGTSERMRAPHTHTAVVLAAPRASRVAAHACMPVRAGVCVCVDFICSFLWLAICVVEFQLLHAKPATVNGNALRCSRGWPCLCAGCCLHHLDLFESFVGRAPPFLDATHARMSACWMVVVVVVLLLQAAGAGSGPACSSRSTPLPLAPRLLRVGQRGHPAAVCDPLCVSLIESPWIACNGIDNLLTSCIHANAR